MECTFKDPSIIKKICYALEHSVENLNLVASSEGLLLAAPKTSHTVMREVVLPPDLYEL